MRVLDSKGKFSIGRSASLALLSVVLVTFVAVVLVNPVAAEEEPVEEPDQVEQTSAPEPPRATGDEEEFDPTEEIVEDFSVPFPVDI